MNQALQTIERRVNELGVAEPIVARQGPADQILVQLPGVTDVARAKEIIRNTAILELKIVEQGPFPSEDAARQAYNNALPPDLIIVPGSEDVAGDRRRHADHGLLRGSQSGRRLPVATCGRRAPRSTRTICRPWGSR